MSVPWFTVHAVWCVTAATSAAADVLSQFPPSLLSCLVRWSEAATEAWHPRET